MGLEFIQRRLDFPALMVQRSQLRGRGSFMIQNRSQQSIDGLGAGLPPACIRSLEL